MTAIKTWSATAGNLSDPDGLLTSKATSKSTKSYGPADFDGAFSGAASVTSETFRAGRIPSITTGASVSTYNTTDPIVVKGTWGGVATSENVALSKSGGGETVYGTQPVDFPPGPTFNIPAQLGTGGTFTLGVADVYAPKNSAFEDVSCAGSGNLALGYQDGSSDTLAIAAAGTKLGIEPNRILRATTAAVTVYWGSSTRSQ